MILSVAASTKIIKWSCVLILIILVALYIRFIRKVWNEEFRNG